MHPLPCLAVEWEEEALGGLSAAALQVSHIQCLGRVSLSWGRGITAVFLARTTRSSCNLPSLRYLNSHRVFAQKRQYRNCGTELLGQHQARSWSQSLQAWTMPPAKCSNSTNCYSTHSRKIDKIQRRQAVAPLSRLFLKSFIFFAVALL